MSNHLVRTAGLIVLVLVVSPAVAFLQTCFAMMPPKVGVLYIVSLAFAAVSLAWRSQRTTVVTSLPQRSASVRVLGLTVLATESIATASEYWIPLRTPSSLVHLPETPWGVVSILLGAAAVAPVLEESLFRGFLLSRLRRYWSSKVSVFISALAFAYIHEDPSRFVSQLFAGLLLGAIVVSTGRLWLAMITHGAINLGGLPFAYPTSAGLPEQIGIAFPLVFLTLALLATLELRRVLTTTRWADTPVGTTRVCMPLGWELQTPI
jgi:membrane protease YdiL (CAAX protease family)